MGVNRSAMYDCVSESATGILAVVWVYAVFRLDSFLLLSLVSFILRRHSVEISNNNVVVTTVSSKQVKRCTCVRSRH